MGLQKMKRPHRDFVVEIKSSPRLAKTKSSSIWGSFDPKAHATEVEDELRERKVSSAIQNLILVSSAPDNVSPDRLPEADAGPGGQGVTGASSEALDPTPVNIPESTKVDVVPKTRTGAKRWPRKVTSRERAGNALPIVQPEEASVISDSISKG